MLFIGTVELLFLLLLDREDGPEIIYQWIMPYIRTYFVYVLVVETPCNSYSLRTTITQKIKLRQGNYGYGITMSCECIAFICGCYNTLSAHSSDLQATIQS